MPAFDWLTDETRDFLARDYLLEGQSAEGRISLICDAAERRTYKGFGQKLWDNLSRGWYSLSTPIWTNFGTDRGLPISCFGSHISDSMESILGTVAEVGMMTKFGGGTAGWFGELRPRGAEIRDNGQSHGPVHFIGLFDSLIRTVSQGNTRRGNFAAYLPIDHPDAEEFLRIKSDGHPVQHVFPGVSFPPGWMDAMLAGDWPKRKLWAKVLESRCNNGLPYLFFEDNANAFAPDVYKGQRIRHSQLCVAAGELAVTGLGLRRVEDLASLDAPLTLFDGGKAVEASPMRLIKKSAPVLEVRTCSGRVHRVTPDHKIKTDRGMVEASGLAPGDLVAVQAAKGLFGPLHAPQAACVLGMHQSSRSGTMNACSLSEWEELLGIGGELAECLEASLLASGSPQVSGRRRRRRLLVPPDAVPDWVLCGDEETQRAYLLGLGLEGGVLRHLCEPLLRQVQAVMANLGLGADVADGRLTPRPASPYESVVSVRAAGEADVYCCEVDSQEHVWTCSGFVTSNCTEIMLPTGPDESFVCDLSSMNTLKYDEWSSSDAVEVITTLLDAVMSEFVEKAARHPELARAVRFARRHRALGLGQVGWHSYLQSRMIPIDSMAAKLLNVQIARSIKEAAYEASAKLASLYGEPEVCRGFGRRNSTLLAIAPTKSSAFILGQVSESVEPVHANYLIKDRAKGKYTYKNPHLKSLLASRGLDTQESWASILKAQGSVQHLDCLSQDEKDVFKTIKEISPRELVVLAAARQKHIDQGQSINLFVNPRSTDKEVHELHLEAWRLGLKSLYYQYNENAAQALACKSCEA